MKKGCAGIPLAIPLGSGMDNFVLPGTVPCHLGEPPERRALENLEGELLRGLENPLGSPPLRELVRGRKRIVILIEDNTRSTPLPELLPPFLDYLNRCGVGDDAVSLLTAPGTHRPMTEEELVAKVGRCVYGRLSIVQHDVTRPETLCCLGEIRSDECVVPLWINEKALEADLLIGTGSILPHADAGFSGGAKIVQPGICGVQTTAATHALGIFQKESSLGKVENPCRRAMDQVALRAGLAFIVNAVKSGKDDTVALVAGHPVAAHRRGAALAAEACRLSFPWPADIVIAGSKPFDIDFWQAEKALVSASSVLRRGGILILAAACPEGLVHNHPTFREWLRLSVAEIQDKVRSMLGGDDIGEIIAADGAVWVARVRERGAIFLVAPGLGAADVEAVGARSFLSVQEALDLALKRIPRARVAVIPEGGGLLPMLA